MHTIQWLRIYESHIFIAYHSLVQKNDSASRLCASRVQCIINSATACENLAFDVTDGIIEFRSF